MRQFFILLLLCIVPLTVTACSDDSGNDPGNPDVVEDGDGSQTDTDGSETDTDSEDGEDSTDLDEDTVCTSDCCGDCPVGEPCISDIQCQSSLCVQFAAGAEGFCSQICETTEDCPSSSSGGSYECLALPRNSNDNITGCIDTAFCFDPDEDGYGVGPGCPNRGFDCNQTDESINPAASERCDDIDHNCNGLLIDAVTFESETCEVGGQIGACNLGQPRCEAVLNESDEVVDGTLACDQIISPGDQPEVCNGLDDDCDGFGDEHVYEDGSYEVPGLGISCSTGSVSCTGTLSCDASSGETVCLGDGSNTGGSEPAVCNGLDENCDGIADEDYRNSDGIYHTLEHCGSCNVNCNNLWGGTPGDFHVVPMCNVDTEGGFALCDFECAEDFVNADGLDDNGCELNPDEEAIYVARPSRGGSDTDTCGSTTAPCATIAHGISRASSESGKTRVRVAEGTYNAPIDMVDGIGVLGGHNGANWTRDIETNVTTITGIITTANQQITVRAEDITSNTTLSGLTIAPPPATDGRTSVGLLVRDSSSALTIENNRIIGSQGAQGISGTTGSNGESGVPGASGSQSTNNISSCSQSSPSAGGVGGSKSCTNLRTGANVDVSGGKGANGQKCPDFGIAQTPGGDDGMGPDSPDNGGQSAHYWEGYYPPDTTRCLQPDEPGEITDGSTLNRFPEDGGRGPSGDDGTAGVGATDANGSITPAGWVGQSGGSGQAGLPGNGGGGGGAAGGLEVRDNIGDEEGHVYVGASGGGGGSGGCAGEGGGGGSAGGGSFAVMIIASSDATMAPTMSGNTIARGEGGQGGQGGNAGAGGDGGQAGSGGQGQGGGNFGFCMANGETGGVGGRGGHGGGGGGGAGGASFDILISSPDPDTTASNAGAIANNDFPLGASQNTGGDGGDGGSSQSNPGQDGKDGASGQLLKLQP